MNVDIVKGDLAEVVLERVLERIGVITRARALGGWYSKSRAVAVSSPTAFLARTASTLVSITTRNIFD